jgi:hypothetical protein
MGISLAFYWFCFQGIHCPLSQGQTCSTKPGNPNYGFTAFDNFGLALIQMFQV